jgi:hypothetical protein
MCHLICGLFSNVATSSDYTASDDGLINELERTWKEAVVAKFKVLSRIWLKRRRKTTENVSQDSKYPSWSRFEAVTSRIQIRTVAPFRQLVRFLFQNESTV